MRLIAILSILAVLLLRTAPADAAGCTCSPDPFENRWKAADAVFQGTVVKIKDLPEYVRKNNAHDRPVRVIVRVDEKFKGPETTKNGGGFELQTSLTQDTCTGHPFVEGKSYLIYAYQRDSGKFEAWSLYGMPAGTYDVGGLCGGTKIMTNEQTAPEIEQIRKTLEEEAANKPKGIMDKLFGN
jgi:hypothetical protein